MNASIDTLVAFTPTGSGAQHKSSESGAQSLDKGDRIFFTSN